MKQEHLKEILNIEFGLDVTNIKSLVGYETLNYRISTNEKKYVVKVYDYDLQTLEIIKGESDFQKHLVELDCEYPAPIPTRSGDDFFVYNHNKIIRCLTFLEGIFLAEVDHTDELISHFGSTLANLNIKTRDLYIPSLQAKQISWDLSNTHWSRDNLVNITEPRKRSLVDYFLLQFDSNVRPIMHQLPSQIIHNDANDWNVLCADNKVKGIIDFGDAVYSTRISEIAVALSYVIVEKEDPIHLCEQFLQAYHNTNPITEKEIDALYLFISARMCISLISSATSRRLDPSNEYISISEKGYWSLLDKWITINPIEAKNRFRTACGYAAHTPKPVSEILKLRHQNIPEALSISYNEPIHMESAALQYMYGTDGITYLDAYNNIPHVGHEHPRVVAAANAQIAKLNTNTRYLFDPLQEYSEKILAKFPAELNQVFFVNSGSAASDLAIRLSRNYTNRDQLIVMEHGYHGNTQQGIAISHYKYNSKGGKGKIKNIIEAALPNTYVDGFTNDNTTTGERYATNLINEINDHNNIAAFIAEPISGCGGQVPLAPNYLKTLYPYLKEKGILAISDEVQTGFGRLGDYFWGFEMHNVVPDIVILGKPMGNGHPMAAVVTTKKIADAFNNGMEFFSSFGGNPVSCETGSAVLDVIEDENLQDQAKRSGEHFYKLMSKLKSKYKCIGDLRGSGLFLGIEIIDPTKKGYSPDTKLAKHIKNEMRNHNILVSTDGPYDNVVKMKPSLCFNEDNMTHVISTLENILNNIT